VPIGYGDGLPRTFGRGAGRVLINGRVAPVVARVSMDQITVDVSDAGEVRLGDEVVLIGRSGDSVQTADDVAAQTGTINYDILCGIMPRVPRVYVDGGVIVGSTRYFSPAPTPADGADPRST
jgi:alanine racemase